MMVQAALFGREAPSFDERFDGIVRRELGEGAWVEQLRGFVRGHDVLFNDLLVSIRWRTVTERMYERTVLVPRVVASLPDDGPGHPLIDAMRQSLSARYGEAFSRVGLALYRDGSDSVAWHGDRVARRMDTALVATVSLGAPRTFLMRPYGGGTSIKFTLGWGDLFVMGGTCQRTWQHSVPKVARAEARIAVMFRPVWEGSGY
jgi:alkylated DNA repair dioxygenase AlkB